MHYVPIGTFAGVTVRDMAGSYTGPFMIPQPFWLVQLLFTSLTLQAPALITLKDCFICPTANIALLAQKCRVLSFLRSLRVGTHLRIALKQYFSFLFLFQTMICVKVSSKISIFTKERDITGMLYELNFK